MRASPAERSLAPARRAVAVALLILTAAPAARALQPDATVPGAEATPELEAGGATEPPVDAAPAPPPPPLDAAADAVLRRTCDLLANTQRFSFQARITYDVLQPSGQMLQFGETQTILVHRPNRVTGYFQRDDGERRRLWYDGYKLILLHRDQNVFGVVPFKGLLDDALDYAVTELGIRWPLADLLASDPYAALTEQAEDGGYVGEHVVDGMPCDHVALRLPAVDGQLWIEQGAEPVPRKVVLTYRYAPGEPQFTAYLDHWNLNPDFSEQLFVFAPPKGAEQIRILPLPDDLRPVAAAATPASATSPATPAEGIEGVGQ